MKIITFIGLIILSGMVSVNSYAELPKTINLQSIIYDKDGNVTSEPFVDIIIRISDESNNVLFQEEHNDVPVVQGAINLNIGETVGGIPVEALDPKEGRKFFDIVVNGTTPFDLMAINSVPYSIWSDKALSVADNSIGAENIKDGAIEFRHLAEQLKFSQIGGAISDEQIPSTIVRKEAFDAHINSETSHYANSILIDKNGSLPIQLGSTVQLAIENLYGNVTGETVNRRLQDANIQAKIKDNDNAIASINTNISNLSGSVTNLNNQMSSATSTLSNHEIRLQNTETTVSNHSNSISSINSQIVSINSQVASISTQPESSAGKAFAYGVIGSDGNKEFGYNYASSSHNINGVIINFEQVALSNNVVISATPMEVVNQNPLLGIEIIDMNSSGFTLRCATFRASPSDGHWTHQYCQCPRTHWVAYSM